MAAREALSILVRRAAEAPADSGKTLNRLKALIGLVEKTDEIYTALVNLS
jgi:hypothetical protein